MDGPQGPVAAGEEAAHAWELLGLFDLARTCATDVLPAVMSHCSQAFPVDKRGKARR